jgi:hypothetical protein
VNVSSVTHLQTGVYCVLLNGIAGDTVAAVASVFDGTAGREVANTAPGFCSAPAGIQVDIWRTTTNLLVDEGFSIVIP